MKNKKHYKKHGSRRSVQAKKFLGQHFLKDEQIARKIGTTLDLKETDNVLEIGPGTGMLTKYLLEHSINLVVMEVDSDSVAYLRQGFSGEEPTKTFADFDLIEADFLKYDLEKLFPQEPFAVTGNFPYNISSQILFKTLYNRERIPEFSGMFQKEVAKRICEGPGSKTYGILSVLTQAFYEAEYLFTVPPSVFAPRPKVESGVLKLTRKPDYKLSCDEDLFFKVVKRGFQQRRKTLRNSLKSFDLGEDLKKRPLFSKRPEQLSVTEFIALTNLIDEGAKKIN